MSLPEQKYNMVIFRPYGPDGTPSSDMPDVWAFLTLRTPWNMSCGLRPDINSAVVPWPEYEKISDKLDRPGRIEFWFNSRPPLPGAPSDASPDVALEYVTCVGVDVNEIGAVPPDKTVRPTEYTLLFEDFRLQFVEPRGGRLRMGLINPGPLVGDGTGHDQGPDQPPYMPFSDLIPACLKRMGLSGTTLPDDVDSLPAPRELKWLGNHAPTELGKLLEAAGLVFCPQFDGTCKIERAKSEGTPAIHGGGARLPDLILPPVDRRGKFVVFTSYPSQVLLTEETEGGTGDDAANYWELVIQDTDDSWVTYDNCSLLKDSSGNPNADDQARQGFSKVDEKYRGRVLSQFGRFIRLRSKFWPSNVSPLRPTVTESDLSEIAIRVSATIAIQDSQTGLWDNSKDDVQMWASHLVKTNILELPLPLVTVKSACSSIFAGYDTTAQFSVRYTVPKSHEDSDSGRWIPDYFEVGFYRDSEGAVQKMTDDDRANAIDGETPDVLVIRRPELVLANVDGSDANRDNLESRMQTVAERYLRTDKPGRQIRTVGFAAIQPSGLVSQVQWDQQQVMTSANTSDWFTVQHLLAGHLDLSKTAPGDAYPNQGRMESDRIASGAPGAVLPNAPVMPIAPPPVLPLRFVQITGNCTCGEMYNGVVLDTLSPAPDPTQSTFSFTPGTDKVIVCNLAGMSQTSHVLAPGTILPFWDGPAQKDGTPTVFVIVGLSYRYNTTTHKLQFATVLNGQNASPALPDTAWQDVVQFVSCSGT